MHSNPFYFNLKTDLHTTKEKKSYKMIQLGEGLSKSLVFRGKNYHREEQHCSVYEHFSPSDPAQSPIHYTALYIGSDGKKITLHGFYDQYGNYVLTQVRCDGSKNTETLSLDEEMDLKNLIKSEATPHLETLFGNLFAAQKKAELEQKAALKDLEDESYKGMMHAAYLNKLNITIKHVEYANNLNFFPDYSISNFLKKHQTSLKKSQKKAKKPVTSPAQTSMPEMKETSLETREFVDAVASTSNINAAVQTPVYRKKFLESLNEQELYHELDKCASNSLNDMLQIAREIDKCKLKTGELLIDACKVGDLEKVKKLFADRQIMAHKLLSTAVIHNQREIFAYIYRVSKFKDMMNYVSSCQSTSPIESNVHAKTSFLPYAIEQDNFDFFKELLETYKVEPNLYTLEGFPLLTHLIKNHEEPYRWVQSLLAAKANPEIKANPQIKRDYAPENKKEDPTPISKITPLDVATIRKKTNIMELLLMAKATPSRIHVDAAIRLNYDEGLKLLLQYKADPNRCPEYYPLSEAVQKGYAPIVKLLLENGANSKQVDANRATIFSEVSHAPKGMVKKDILEAFIKAGHSIDEPRGLDQTTGLYHQCLMGNLDGVKIFLALGAKPDLIHTLKMLVGGSLKLTPLGIAAVKNHKEIVQVILDEPQPSSKVILDALALCRLYCNTYDKESSCDDILTSAYYEACKREETLAFS